MTAELTDNIARAAEFLRTGRLVAFATETVYGLGANALDERAVARVFSAKQRPHFDPLIVHLAEPGQAAAVVATIPPVAQRLMDRFWPGPLTLVLPKRAHVPDLVTAGLGCVAIRVPDHPQARELIRQSGVPVAAPSANPFGRISPTTAVHVMSQLAGEIDLVLEGGACRIGVESTVLSVEPNGEATLLRPGGLPVEEIEALIGPVLIPAANADDAGPQAAPGRLLKHYAPRTPLVIADHWDSAPRNAEMGALALRPFAEAEHYRQVEILSATGDLAEAAANFFSALRRLDDAGLTTIVAVPFPDHGLGRALNDRLQRAAR